MIALALEANGYLPYGREIGFLADGNQHEGGKQCALCERKEKGHGLVAEDKAKGVPEHNFKQAKYILLTGNDELTPNKDAMVVASRNIKNKDGSQIKVILGSQIASEGLDLKYVREVFVFDSWYHLNKLEQIIGRGIRTCSHAALEKKRKLYYQSFNQCVGSRTMDQQKQ
jgi:hypothetical protein